MEEATIVQSLFPGLAQEVNWAIILALVFFWMFSMLISLAYLPVRIGVFVITAKFLLVGSYFLYWGNGSWTIGADDWSYALVGYVLLESGENPISVWFSPMGSYFLLGRPNTALYNWWNMLWMYLIEPAYYAPVVANVSTTVVCGFLFYKILAILGFSQTYRIGFACFYLLHWNTLAWSSFLNIKEPLIVLLMLLIIYSILCLEKRKWGFIIPLSIGVLLMQWLRFYIPALIGGAYIIHVFFRSRQKIFAVAMISLVVSLLWWKYSYTLNLVERLVNLSPISISKHLVKNFVSPLPWKITAPATYLYLPSILHLVLLPGAIVGLISLTTNRQTVGARLIVLTIAAGYVFYSLIPGLASVRHLGPFAALWILCEYNFIYFGLKNMLRHGFHDKYSYDNV